MIPKNLCLFIGLVNGTRCRVLRLGVHTVTVRILTGRSTGRNVVLPRLRLSDKDAEKPAIVVRHQIPLRVAYGITIHKSQSMTLERAGLFLTRPVWDHGMLHVAISRAQMFKDLHIFVKDSPFQGRVKLHGKGNRFATTNIVDRDVLEFVMAMNHQQ